MNLPVIFLTDDAQIKEMLVRQQIPMARPEPPNDVILTSFEDAGQFWVVMRFYQQGDDGFIALGIPKDSPEEMRRNLGHMVLEHIEDMARSSGTDAWADATMTEVKPVEMN